MPLSGVAVSIGRNSFDPPAPVVPVFDIHARSMELHDSGANAGSGIIQYNGALHHLQVNPGGSGVQPVVTAVLFEAYDNAGGNSINAAVSVIAIATTRINTHSNVFSFNSGAGELTLNMPGTYEVTYRTSFDINVNTRSSTQSRFQFKTTAGGTFANIGGTFAYAYHRQTSNGEGTTTATAILAVKEGYVIRVVANVISGAGVGQVQQIIHGNNLVVRKLA